MKTLIIAFTLLTASFVFPRSMYLSVESVTFTTRPTGNSPQCQVSLKLNADLKNITEASMIIGKEKYTIPAEALSKIEFPDLTSAKVETETGRDGRIWYSIVLKPARQTEFPTRFHITVIDGSFAQVSKSWDEPQGVSIRGHFEILHSQQK